MGDLKKPLTVIARSRRNLLKAAAIGASAILVDLSKMKPAGANCGNNKDVGKGCECFLKGTLIRTADGDRKIEDLAAGDLLPTVFGGVCPIQRIELYRVNKNDPTKAWTKDSRPVRIARSALGPNIPHTDLYVTQGHALLIDDVLVTAGSLINGTTITLYNAHEYDELEFFHITLAHHDVIYAEGAPCETLWDSAPWCAPWFSAYGGRSEIKARFRSAISPWIDRRQKLDIIRDALEERGIALMR